MEILRDRCGKPQGVIRKIVGDWERLYDTADNSIATYRPDVDFTYGQQRARIGSGKPAATSSRRRRIAGRTINWSGSPFSLAGD